MEVGENWGKWQQFLGIATEIGQSIGLNGETIDNAAYKIGSYLSDHFDPANEQQKLLKDLWNSGSEEERRNLASMVVSLTEKKFKNQN